MWTGPLVFLKGRRGFPGASQPLEGTATPCPKLGLGALEHGLSVANTYLFKVLLPGLACVCDKSGPGRRQVVPGAFPFTQLDHDGVAGSDSAGERLDGEGGCCLPTEVWPQGGREGWSRDPHWAPWAFYSTDLQVLEWCVWCETTGFTGKPGKKRKSGQAKVWSIRIPNPHFHNTKTEAYARLAAQETHSVILL